MIYAFILSIPLLFLFPPFLAGPGVIRFISYNLFLVGSSLTVCECRGLHRSFVFLSALHAKSLVRSSGD